MVQEAEAAGAAQSKRVDRRRGSGSCGGGAVYGLGFIGALVWFWQQASGFGEHVVGILKAFVWPAFMVYDAFKSLKG